MGASSIRVGVGSVLFYSPQIEFTTLAYTNHPQYNRSNLNNDIGVIQLNSNLPWSSTISPAKLPKRSEQYTTFEDQQMTVSGFGKISDSSPGGSNRLKYTYLRVISNTECSGIYGSSIVQGFTLCTRGWSNTRHSSCGGDSGGPLILSNTTAGRIVVGVVSFVANNGCSLGFPAGFARVSSYLDWISQQTGITIWV